MPLRSVQTLFMSQAEKSLNNTVEKQTNKKNQTKNVEDKEDFHTKGTSIFSILHNGHIA